MRSPGDGAAAATAAVGGGEELKGAYEAAVGEDGLLGLDGFRVRCWLRVGASRVLLLCGRRYADLRGVWLCVLRFHFLCFVLLHSAGRGVVCVCVFCVFFCFGVRRGRQSFIEPAEGNV